MTNPSDAFSKVQYITLSEDDQNQRLDNYLMKTLKGVPRTYVYRIIRKGEVRINKKRVDAKFRISAGDILRVPPVRIANRAEAPKVSNQIQQSIESRVIFEDKRILIVNKQAGIAVHGGSGINLGLIEAIRQCKPEWKNAELAHRLDRDTSGLIIICKRRAALHYYHELFRSHTKIKKEYLLLAHGKWKGQKQHITHPLERITAPNGERLVKVSANGKASETIFHTIEHIDNYSLMRAHILTGRTHQIRVHSQFMRHPIVGDSKYGLKEKDQLLNKPRLMLHAERLTFKDESDTLQSFTAKPDDNWQQVINAIKHNT